MAKDKDELIEEVVEAPKKKQPDQKVLTVEKNASVDFPVEVVSADGDKFHDNGAKFEVGHKKAIELVNRGGVSLSKKGKEQLEKLQEDGYVTKEQLKGVLGMLLFLFLFSFGVAAQTSVDVTLKNYVYTTLTSDTVTNTGVGAVTSARISGPAQGVTIAVVLTEISGTTAGTLTLQGSLDGTNFKAIPTEETQTAIATATALDVASQVFTWRIKQSPYLYYRVSWTGTGTMSATIAGRLMKH